MSAQIAAGRSRTPSSHCHDLAVATTANHRPPSYQAAATAAVR
ncbi:hypothetical protein [Nonomuraea rosea]